MTKMPKLPPLLYHNPMRDTEIFIELSALLKIKKDKIEFKSLRNWRTFFPFSK